MKLRYGYLFVLLLCLIVLAGCAKQLQGSSEASEAVPYPNSYDSLLPRCVLIKNDTHSDFFTLCIAPSDTKKYGDSLLTEPLLCGEALYVVFVPYADCSNFTLKITDNDNLETVYSALQLLQGSTVSLQYKNGEPFAEETLSGSSESGAAEQGAPQTAENAA